MSGKGAIWALALMTLITFPATAHEGGHGNQVMWQVCEGKPKDSSCTYKSRIGDIHRGTCQSMVEHMVCVENQPVLPVSKAVQTQPPEAASDDLDINDWNKWLLWPGILFLLCFGMVFWLRKLRR